MSIANLVRLVYVLLGVAYLIAGVGVQLYRSDVLHPNVIYVINQVSHDSPTALHILQEFGTHMIALGVIALWFAYNYELSWVFHWAMTIAWGIFGLIHYLDASRHLGQLQRCAHHRDPVLRLRRAGRPAGAASERTRVRQAYVR